jgi:hypothetical protein
MKLASNVSRSLAFHSSDARPADVTSLLMSFLPGSGPVPRIGMTPGGSPSSEPTSSVTPLGMSMRSM